MGRPSASQARQRRDTFARLVANDYAAGGMEQMHRNVVANAKACRLDPWRALKLSYDPAFVGDVYRLAEGTNGGG